MKKIVFAVIMLSVLCVNTVVAGGETTSRPSSPPPYFYSDGDSDNESLYGDYYASNVAWEAVDLENDIPFNTQCQYRATFSDPDKAVGVYYPIGVNEKWLYFIATNIEKSGFSPVMYKLTSDKKKEASTLDGKNHDVEIKSVEMLCHPTKELSKKSEGIMLIDK